MKKSDPKYFTLGKITPNMKPRKTRVKNLEKARVQVWQNYDKYIKAAKSLEKHITKNNEKREASFIERMKNVVEKAKKSGKPFTWAERENMENEHFAGFRFAYKEAYYKSLQFFIEQLGICLPDIDSISPFSIRPGGRLELWGSCFGPSQGKVILQITPNDYVEAEVSIWNENYICSFLNRLFGNVPLRPYYGKVWIQRGDGVTSNVWPLMYYPIYSLYIATWVKRVSGGLFGESKNGTFLRNRSLNDPDFEVERVERHHWGDGWSEKRAPHASGQSMGQGWHIGVSAFGHANMRLLYRVKGPKGINPPYFSQLGAWGYLGDY